MILRVFSESCDFLNLSLGFSFGSVLVPEVNHSLMLSVLFSSSVHFFESASMFSHCRNASELCFESSY